MSKFKKFVSENKKIVIPIVIISIPIIVFIVILLSAALKSGTVIVGKRYKNDLNPAISNDKIKEVESSLDSISGIDSLEVNLKTSQFRVLIDAKDSINDVEAEELCKTVYDKVNVILPINTYFTKDSQGQKMYDLEITVYNDIDNNTNLIIYTLVKNSTMDDYELNNPSSAKDPELVESLRLKEEERKNPSANLPETTPQFTEELEDEEPIDSVE